MWMLLGIATCVHKERCTSLSFGLGFGGGVKSSEPKYPKPNLTLRSRHSNRSQIIFSHIWNLDWGIYGIH